MTKITHFAGQRPVKRTAQTQSGFSALTVGALSPTS